MRRHAVHGDPGRACCPMGHMNKGFRMNSSAAESKAAMLWYLTVIDANGRDILFTGDSPNAEEIADCAREAKRRRPSAKVLVRSPLGTVTEWPWAGGVSRA